MMILPCAVTALSLLDMGLFYLYNKKLHPWSAILAEEKPRNVKNKSKNWFSRVWVCLRGEKESAFLGKIKQDIFW
jgi:hypothetical protein